MRLYIGKRDIEKGQTAKKDPYSIRSRTCPIAQALMRKYPDREVSVFSGQVVIRNGEEIRFDMASDAEDFIHLADKEYDLKPQYVTLVPENG